MLRYFADPMKPQVFVLVKTVRGEFKLMKHMMKNVDSEIFLTSAFLFSSPHNLNQSNKLLFGSCLQVPFLS